MRKPYLETGRIVGTHGVRGELRVQPWSDNPAFLTGFDGFYLDGRGEKRLEAERVRPHGNVVLLKARGVDTIEEAEKLRGKVLYIDRSAVRLEEGRYFIQDLIGCKVVDADSGETLGSLSDVSETGANDVWHVKREGEEYLVPAIPDVIVEVDLDKEIIVLRPLKGIFDHAD
ncbi:MAG: 16S rRNA processing protein RimM [Clostridiales bacterium]|nr:16S rRNA processing protein RimM [Clostridiales bacterium]